MVYNSNNIGTQKQLLMKMLLEFYKGDNLLRFASIIQAGNVINKKKTTSIIQNDVIEDGCNKKQNISLRIIDWFVTNYAKKHFIVYDQQIGTMGDYRFKVYNEYKLKLKSNSKVFFDPFCRWERITIPFDDEKNIETTIGQLNFFKWAIENRILEYIDEHYQEIECDMNTFNSASKRRKTPDIISNVGVTRKKREELSISACKCIKKENIKIIVKFT